MDIIKGLLSHALFKLSFLRPYIQSGCQVDRGISWPDPQSLATYAAKAT